MSGIIMATTIDNNDLLVEALKKNGFKITPSAHSILASAKLTPDVLVDNLKKNWNKFGSKKDTEITVQRAVNILMEASHWIKDSLEVKAEITARKKIRIKTTLPKHLDKTLTLIKKSKKSVSAKQIATTTGRKEITERLYLDKLVKKGYLQRVKVKSGKFEYSLKK